MQSERLPDKNQRASYMVNGCKISSLFTAYKFVLILQFITQGIQTN